MDGFELDDLGAFRAGAAESDCGAADEALADGASTAEGSGQHARSRD